MATLRNAFARPGAAPQGPSSTALLVSVAGILALLAVIGFGLVLGTAARV